MKTPLFVTGLTLGFIGFIGFVAWLIQRVSDGKGTDLYQSHWGINYSAIGVLILIAVAVVAAVIGAYLNHKHNKVEKDFLEKYGKE
jgi:heme/copper-type cytochrome/quinol oxidase subunit 2